MPKNKLLYLGLLVIAAAALIYIGALLANFLLPAVPYAIGVGAVFIVVGLVMESKKKDKVLEQPGGPTPPSPS